MVGEIEEMWQQAGNCGQLRVPQITRAIAQYSEQTQPTDMQSAPKLTPFGETPWFNPSTMSSASELDESSWPERQL